MEVNHFFSTPVFMLLDNHFEKFKEPLLKEVYDWREESLRNESGVTRSNQGGWHSESKIFKRETPAIKRLNTLMVNTFNQCTKHIAPDFDISNKVLKGEGWVNVNEKGDFNVPHDHPGYTWSGVYYLACSLPEVRDVHHRHGCIEFLDPRTSVSAFSPELAQKTEYFSPKKTLYPKPGMILVFPSYLRHWVYPSADENDRITFAYNFKYQVQAEEVLAQAQAEQGATKKPGSKGPAPKKRKKKK
tara:strand:+ start:12827 stop:13558 length:732 start_codon:yes stop_codon:yes gene_type:complete